MFGIGRKLKKATGISSLSILSPLALGAELLGGSAKGTKISKAERLALAEAKRIEEERRGRLLEQQNRRSRVALGSIGGVRQLAYGTAVDNTMPVKPQNYRDQLALNTLAGVATRARRRRVA